MSLLRLLGFKQSKKHIAKINVSQAFDSTSAGSHKLIDVRQPDEWQSTGLPKGSHGIALQDPNFITKVEELLGGDKNAEIALTCRSGKRSMMAANILVNAGFTQVSNVEGGFIDWQRQGLPIESYAANN